jgi:hypothetical protein
MPTEIIGEFGTAGAEREWIAAECELAIKHLKRGIEPTSEAWEIVV